MAKSFVGGAGIDRLELAEAGGDQALRRHAFADQILPHRDGASSPFKSNWDLSAARAISVVQYLIAKGVPPQRLVAAGFGEFQPIDPGTTDEAFSRNRRIELKLTER